MNVIYTIMRKREIYLRLFIMIYNNDFTFLSEIHRGIRQVYRVYVVDVSYTQKKVGFWMCNEIYRDEFLLLYKFWGNKNVVFSSRNDFLFLSPNVVYLCHQTRFRINVCMTDIWLWHPISFYVYNTQWCFHAFGI